MNITNIMLFLSFLNILFVVASPTKQPIYFFNHLQKYAWWQRALIKIKQRQKIPTKCPTTPIIPTTENTATTPDQSDLPSTTETMRENDKVITNYKIVQNLTQPKLFGFSEKEAESFPSRISEIIIPFTGECDSTKLSKYTGKLIEVSDILKKNTCNGQHPTIPARTIARREAVMSSPIQNADGSVTTVRNCFIKGTLTRNNNLRLCSECQAVTRLPDNVFPRFINEVICQPLDQPTTNAKQECLTGSGNCVEKILNIPFRKDTENLGVDRLFEWTTFNQPIRAACNCEIHQDSPFAIFV
uniref:Cnidarian restricted protein n=1 Tax=Clytia hemisphaerica TaxID=252671 RepID=A0A7M6DQS6_9CNID